MRNAFRLPRAANEVVLALVGLVLLKSGHGLRATHLRHHARTLEQSDHPKVQTAQLSELAKVVGPEVAFADRSIVPS